MAVNAGDIEWQLITDSSTKRGVEKIALINVFNMSMLDFGRSSSAFLDLGKGFYITAFKGNGEFNTTKNKPFELTLYCYCEGSAHFLKYNNKRVRVLERKFFMDCGDIERAVNYLIIKLKEN